ncbi:helix-turn-helix transcriptional regulator [Serratia plymuthica]|uniref:Probable transcription repressor NiaR n=1 Tax=Serratia plymuthica TaxID=82996 RepID=A0A2X4UKV8_SERPL|nr:YafY family protein [Serratia plymuthica]QPS21012.1 YafY family transcriptional regulator [Serratia plymuthica]QPS62619.1 YafY family transcriptional regulator [Serratia plymuthica]RKS65074.1 putative DNA-binding transcriptional regulator YafY [Serratia plymuthica]CAI2428221.1 Probable transcription repressor NiaR [Serratia plymuthica]SQI39321.1 Probable transcription repressor NiaR [Serratia plymuthica]
MSRTERLLDLMQILRRHRYPVAGHALAQEMNISMRTLYRDIATLQQQGAEIVGEAGVGYVLRPGFMLPPLMFSPQEIEALVLGMRWVGRRGDTQLAGAANNALAKIADVLPAALRDELEANTLLIGPIDVAQVADETVMLIRDVIRQERKLAVNYCDLAGKISERILWPFALGYFEQARMLVAWCELRQEFRHFRLDRICLATPLAQRYPRGRRVLLKEWYEIQGITPQ